MFSQKTPEVEKNSIIFFTKTFGFEEFVEEKGKINKNLMVLQLRSSIQQYVHPGL